LLRAVGEAAAVGRVPMALWQKARSCPPDAYFIPELDVRPLSRVYMPLRDEPLQKLVHFSWVMRSVARIPLDLQLYIYNFVHVEEARQRALAAIRGARGHFQKDALDTVRIQVANSVFTCTSNMMKASAFLRATAQICDRTVPFCIDGCSTMGCRAARVQL